MDFNIQYSTPKFCTKHNQPIILTNPDPIIDPCCAICLQLLPQYKELDLDHQQFQSLLDQLIKYKKNIILDLDQIIQTILEQIKLIEDLKIKMSSIIQSDSNQQIIIQDIQQISYKQQLINQDAKDEVGNLLQSFKSKYAEIDELSTILKINHIIRNEKDNNTLMNNKAQIQEVQIEQENQFKKFKYELIKESIVKQLKSCEVLAINSDNTILLAGYNNDIIVYQFINGSVSKELQTLTAHSGKVYCLYFMKKSNNFISGSWDKTIIIWVIDQNNTWVVQEILKEHTDWIGYILMNKAENMLISGSYNCSLKFWKPMSGSWICQQSIKTNYTVRCMSFNEKEDKLIVCDNNLEDYDYSYSSIHILMQNNNQQWNIIQTIDIIGQGQKLCFTIGDQFVFPADYRGYLEIYDFDTIKDKFQKVSQLKIQNIHDINAQFPCQYIKSMNILAFLNGMSLKIIKVNENYNYELIQTIEFDNYHIQGVLTDDGQYLISWDLKSKEILIRQIKYQE